MGDPSFEFFSQKLLIGCEDTCDPGLFYQFPLEEGLVFSDHILVLFFHFAHLE